MVQGRNPSQDDFRYWIGKNLHKYIRGGLDKEEVNVLKEDIETFLSKYEEDISLQLSLIVPISLPPGKKPGFSKKLVTDCEMLLAKVCGGFTTLISEGGWYDNDQFVKDYHRSIYSEFKLSSWIEVCRTLTEIVLQIQESAKQRCVWVSIDGVADEVNLLRVKEIKSFPQQNEFGGVDPEFSEVETRRLPEKYEPIPIHQLNANFSFGVGSGILGGTGNKIDNSTTYVTNNHVYAIPGTSKPPLVAKNSVVDKIETLASREAEEFEGKLIEFEKRLITYPEENLPEVNQNYSSTSIRRFIKESPEKKGFKIDFDDVYKDWSEIKQFIRIKLWHSIVSVSIAICSIISLCNLLGLCSINEIRGLEFFFIGGGLLVTQDFIESSSPLSYNPMGTVGSYVFIGPLLFGIFLMPIIGITGNVLYWLFDIDIFWTISFDSGIFEEYLSFFTTNVWAYSISIHFLYDTNWRLNSDFDNQILTRNVDESNGGHFSSILKWLQLLFAGYLLNICAEVFFNLGVIVYLVFFGLILTWGVYVIFTNVKALPSLFHSFNTFLSDSKNINLQIDLFQRGTKGALSEHDLLVVPSFQLYGRYHLNTQSTAAILDDYCFLSLRVLVCDLIRNNKFNLRRLPSKLTLYPIIMFMWASHMIYVLLTSIFILPMIIVNVFLSFFILLGGLFQEKKYFFTISENLFNLDHERIKNEIEPRIHEMSSNSAIRAITNSYNYRDCLFTFYITDFLCYASGTKHLSQILKSKQRKRGKNNLTKKKQRKRR